MPPEGGWGWRAPGQLRGRHPAQGYTAEIESNGTVNLWRVDNWTLLGSNSIPGFSLGTWYTLALRANGTQLSVEVNGSTVIGPVTDSAFTSGDAGVWSYSPGSAGSHRFDNFSVTVLGGGHYTKTQGLARIRGRSLSQLIAPPANTTYRLYYYANGQPIAMRELPPGNAAGTLYFLHSDHLGSTSAVTNLSGSVVARQWYDPYGAVRASTGTLPTKRTFTGQLADETGLYFYNARYYAPLMGRFISADTIVPEPGNPQALNRYAYGLNNPLKYIDPSGHVYLCAQECDDGNWSPSLSAFGIDASELTALEQLAILAAAQDVGAALLATNPVLGTAAEAFKAVYGFAGQSLSFKRCPAGACSALGWTQSSTEVWFNPFVYSKASHPDDWWERTVHLVVHEMGHVFNARMTNVLGALAEKLSPYNQLFRTQVNNPAFPNREGNQNVNFGFAGRRYNWQQSADPSHGEEFADMFLGWTYNRWDANPDGSLTFAGQGRADWMTARMPLWVDIASAVGGGDSK